jgi:hypothetical protein
MEVRPAGTEAVGALNKTGEEKKRKIPKALEKQNK